MNHRNHFSPITEKWKIRVRMQRSRLTHLAAARYDAAQLGQKISEISVVFCISSLIL